MNAEYGILKSANGQAMPRGSVPIGKEAFMKRENTALYWLGSASIIINTRGTVILMDPVLTDFDAPLLFELPLSAQDVPFADAVLVTHSDSDHYSRGTCRALNGNFHSTKYVAGLMEKDGINGTGHAINESFVVKNTVVTLTPADHDWQNAFPAYNYRVWEKDECCGFFVRTPDGNVWLPGDSKLMKEHLLLSEAPDVILLDFSDDPFHISFEGAVTLANAYPEARLVCVHWGTYDAPEALPFNADPTGLFDRVKNPERIVILCPGEEYAVALD